MRDRGWKIAFGVFACIAPLLAAALPATARAGAGSPGQGTGAGIPPLSAEYLSLAGLRAGLNWAAHLDAESVVNLSGGLERELTSDLAAQAGFALDTARSGWWPGGLFRVTALAVASGDSPAETVGDVQGVSNVAAASRLRLYDFSYRQRLTSAATVRAGLMDLNATFVVTGTASTLINSSFGIMPTLSANVPSPIYPHTGLGAALGLHAHGAGLRLGVFQGDPARPASLFSRGYLALAEGHWHAAHRALVLKMGVWHYVSGNAAPDSTDNGLYVIAEARRRLVSGGWLGGFLQYGTSTRATDPVPRYAGLGLRWEGPFRSRPTDLFSIGVARAWVRGARAETSYEVTYAAHVVSNVYLQPDLQYVVHPGGYLPDALVGILRIHLEMF